MKIALIGLGKMGRNMAARLCQHGHEVIGYDVDPESRRAAEAAGANTAATHAAAIFALSPPRVVWLMLPAGEVTDRAIDDAVAHMASGDIIVEGGNARYTDTRRRKDKLAALGIELVDVGTSGGVWGLENGYSLMIGGDRAVVDWLRPLFESLAPAPDRGWGHVGDTGAGHFVKMVHNGIEYGLMQAYSEGFAMLRKTEMDLDLAQIAEIWRSGSVVQSWLLDLIARALHENPEMEGIAPHVADSGEGRWTVAEAIDLNVPAPVITMALLSRLRSRDDEGFSDRLLSALRNQFGGHAIKGE